MLICLKTGVYMKFIILFLISLSSFASTFTSFGELKQTQYKSPSSPLDFRYDLVYYLPKSLETKKNYEALVFLHGGGQSTISRSGSLNVTKMYAHDLMDIADRLGIALILPSGSGLNWGSHMITLLKDLNYTIRKELAVNPNKIALSGHSMGGMGITRSSFWLADEYAFFLPIAAGMDKKYADNEQYIKTFFNTKYLHLQGLNDHFQVFVERCQYLNSVVLKLESKLKKQSLFDLEIYQGSHNYDKNLTERRLDELFKSHPRNLYQKELHGVLYYRNEILNTQWSYGNDFYMGPRDRYFWIKATAFKKTKKVANVDASITQNKVTIKTSTEILKELRVYLSHKMVDLSKKITVTINGRTYFSDMVKKKNLSAEKSKDPGFNFDSYVDIKL
jgi:hypothetical protein